MLLEVARIGSSALAVFEEDTAPWVAGAQLSVTKFKGVRKLACKEVTATQQQAVVHHII